MTPGKTDRIDTADITECPSPEQVSELLWQRFIEPTRAKREHCVGIEIELPLVNLSGGPVDFTVVHALTRSFAQRFGFLVENYDDQGDISHLKDPATGDLLTYDCSYNTLELSFAKADDLWQIEKRFSTYYRFIRNEFLRSSHTPTGMGINPHFRANRHEPIPTGRYRMLYHHLQSARLIKNPRHFHAYPDFGMFSAASQVQIDVNFDRLIQTIHAFSLLEPIKAALFSNAVFSDAGVDYVCGRDMLWERSMQGYNPRNIGMFERPPLSTDELLDYLKTLSIYCVERDGNYINFLPVPITEYFALPTVSGEYYRDGSYHSIDVEPRVDDLHYLRSFKFEDLTFRGTIEYRSVCCQPVQDTLCVAALHLGLSDRVEQLSELLETDRVLYHHGPNAVALRRLMVQRSLPDFLNPEKFRQLLLAVLALAEEGLRARGMNEEHFLLPLFERAERLSNPARDMLHRLEKGTTIEAIIEDYARM